MEHSQEFLRCLTTLDIPGVRKLWHHVAPHLHQPQTDEEALHTLHLARSRMEKQLPASLVTYSKNWLQERQTGRIAHAVGIAVGFHGEPDKRKINRALNTRGEMEHAVAVAIQDGVDLEFESDEVKRRMMVAREKA